MYGVWVQHVCCAPFSLVINMAVLGLPLTQTFQSWAVCNTGRQHHQTTLDYNQQQKESKKHIQTADT